MMQKTTLIVVIVVLILAVVVWGLYLIAAKPGGVGSSAFEVQGVKVEILKNGSGEGAKEGDKITAHYTGTLVDGTKFDSSRDRNTPFTFDLGKGKVIKGWDVGVVGMKVGEVRRITIPPELGYKSVELPKIPANSVLVFEIELLKIN